MNKLLIAMTIILILTALALGSYLFLSTGRVSVPVRIQDPAGTPKSYASPEHGIAFTYSSDYYLKELHAATAQRPQLAIVLVEDAQEHRDLLEGRSAVARDGPVAITVDAYPNPDRLPAEDWVRADANWAARTSDAAPYARGTITGITYSWSGLYEGKSVVATEGRYAYVFSVTWLEPDDPLLAEFDRLLGTVTFAQVR